MYPQVSYIRKTIPLFLVCVCMGANTLRAQFNYLTNNDGIVITQYTSSEPDVTIPNTLNGLPVIGIDTSALSGCQTMTNVTIPDSVTSIGLMAFYYSTNLARAAIGNGVTNIGSMAFSRCSSLRTVNFGKSIIRIQSSAFAGCTPLTDIALPTSLTQIGDLAFDACANLESVTIPRSVSSMGIAPFLGCSRLTNITVDVLNTNFCSQDGVLLNSDKTALIQFPCGRWGGYAIPETVTRVGGYAFQLSVNLTNVTIPVSVMNIGSYAFKTCSNLQAIWVDAGSSNYCSQDGVLLNSNRSVIIQCPGGKIGNWEIPSSVTSIGVTAFERCARLDSVIIPSTVTNVGAFAFSACTLTNLFFLGNPCNVASGAFSFDPELTVYYLPGSIGWTNPWNGLPALLWNPQVVLGNTRLGMNSDQFSFTITGTTNIPVVIEGSDGLPLAAWIPLASGRLLGGSMSFIDPHWTNYPGRLYRIRSP